MAEEAMKGDVFTLTDEEGKEEQFELIGQCTYGDAIYYALVSVEGSEEEYVILRLEEEDGETILVTVDDDDEFEAVADIFDDQVFGDIDYDEGEEDEE